MMTNEEIKAGFDEVIERIETENTHQADMARLFREFFTNPDFRRDLEDMSFTETYKCG